LQQFLTSNGVDFSRGMKPIFEEHLSQFITWFEKYFENYNIYKFAWIQDPFNATALSEFTAAEEENLIELPCDNTFFFSQIYNLFYNGAISKYVVRNKTKFSTMKLTEFGCQ
jgi:hypothetical protein